MRGGEWKASHWQRAIETRYARDEEDVVLAINLERSRLAKRRELADEERQDARRKAVSLPKLKFLEGDP